MDEKTEPISATVTPAAPVNETGTTPDPITPAVASESAPEALMNESGVVAAPVTAEGELPGLTDPEATVAPATGGKLFKCPLCSGVEYEYKAHYIRHVKLKHLDKFKELTKDLPAGPGLNSRGVSGPGKERVAETTDRIAAMEPGPGQATGSAAPPDFSDLEGGGPAPGQPDPMTPVQAAENYRPMAEMLFDSGVGVAVMTFGKEWQPKNPDERNAVVTAIQRYCEAKQVKDIPPGMVLTIVLIAYAGPRFRAPETSTKLKFAWIWIKSKVTGLFRRKSKLPVNGVTPFPG